MEHLETQKKIITLGRLLVEQLKLNEDRDTLSKWMAYYVSEQIVKLEETTDEPKKSQIQKECFDVILKLWENRYSLPDGSRPFEKFESILAVLEKLDPDNQEPLYVRGPFPEIFDSEEEISPCQSLDPLDTILEIDKIAKIWIEYFLEKSIENSSDHQSQKLVAAGMDLYKSNDLDVMTILISGRIPEDKKEEAVNSFQLKKLQSRITELEKFSQINNELLSIYKKEIGEIQ